MVGGVPFDIRRATAAELGAANRVVEAAVMGWDLPERVKRLTLPSYRYQPHDLEHLDLVVGVDRESIVGVAAWEPAQPGDGPIGAQALLLHGLYVAPERQGEGLGTRLLGAADAAAREGGFDGVLVKAQRAAQPFFCARGFTQLPVADPDRDYPHRFWRPIQASP